MDFYGGLECVGHSYAYVAHLSFTRDLWIRTQSAAVASCRATDLATYPNTTSEWMPKAIELPQFMIGKEAFGFCL